MNERQRFAATMREVLMAQLQNIGRREALIGLVIVLVGLLTLSVLRTAWLSDDAMITFRVVLNTANGYGPVFNLDERAQPYTHPLWFGLLVVNFLVSGELFVSTLILSTLLTIGSVALILRHREQWDGALIVILLGLLFSKAFIEYATSGLENPLAYLLFALLIQAVRTQRSEDGRSFASVTFLISLILLTRFDFVVLVTPLALLAIVQCRKPALIVPYGLAGGAPLLLWLAFSLFYYGFPFPNTYYSKVVTDIPRLEFLERGAQYYLNLFQRDPASLLLIVLGLAGAVLAKTRLALALSAGLTLYLAYVFYIGGDFMAGRFFAVPVFVACLALAQIRFTSPIAVGGLGLLVVALGVRGAPLYASTNFEEAFFAATIAKGVTDERAYFYKDFGLFSASRAYPNIDTWQARPSPKKRRVERVWLAGADSLRLGPNVHVVESIALVNPLLAHLPPMHEPGWRVGHLHRYLPTGYWESIEQRDNLIADPAVRSLYDDIRAATRGPLLASGRLGAIVRLNFGQSGRAIDRDAYVSPISCVAPFLPRVLTAQQVSKPKRMGFPIDRAWDRVFCESQDIVFSEPVQNPKFIDISLDNNDAYRVDFESDGVVLDSLQLGPTEQRWEGLRSGLNRYRMALPPSLASSSIDTVRITALEGDGWYAIGHLLFPDQI